MAERMEVVMNKNKAINIFYILLFSLSLSLFPVLTMSTETYVEQKELSLKQMLLMPGKVVKSHAKIESQCNKCHLHFDKLNQAPLCLDCHENIQKDLDNKTNFHSTITKNKITKCSDCHTDHKGREHDISSLDIDRFEHDRTEFKLEGSHKNIQYNQCHLEKYDGFRIELTDNKCMSCHEDTHQGKFEETCQQCHNSTSWRTDDFDHGKTNFNLQGKHQDLSCQSCHINDISMEIGDQCVNCHRGKDKHLGVFKDKCQSCHNEDDWQENNYNHFSETEYALLGEHKSLKCNACHFEELSPEKQCSNCHKNDDIHLGNNGKDCQGCHNNDKWQDVNFDHLKETEVALIGAHEKLSCNACHLPGIKEKEDIKIRQCSHCHTISDVHQGNLGNKCQNCHQQQEWDLEVTFNHDFALFPLTGSHQLVMCQSCHAQPSFSVKSFSCVDCHSEEDNHQSSLGEQCESCHNTASWSSWQFNHQEQTTLPLEGAHENLECGLCHLTTLPKPLFPDKSCISCHQSDDTHKGSFGTNCQQCHTTDGFYEFKH